MNTTYYYIDESGGVNINSDFFILGCYKTDTPEKIRTKINSLQNQLIDDPYFAFERDKILKHGFHASTNHFDVKARFFSLIATLNVRAYILVLKKDSPYFRSLVSKGLKPDEIYSMCIKKLLFDRLTKTRKDKNIIIFEQYGSKNANWLSNVKKVIDEIRSQINLSFGIKPECEVKVHDKTDVNLSVIDYINYILSQFFEHGKLEERMIQNFQIIEPKIGLVYKMDQDRFYHKNNRLDITKY